MGNAVSVATKAAAVPRRTVTAAEVAELLASVRYILLDLDGVVWTGQHVLPKIPQTLAYLRSCGKQIRFLTNNASVSRAGFVRRFQRRGIEGVQEHEVYNSGFAAALRLQSMLAAGKSTGSERPLVERNVFVVGEDGLHEEVRRVLAPGYITYGLELHDAEKCGGYDANVLATAWERRVLPAPLQASSCGVTAAGSGAGGISLSDLDPAAVVVGLDLHFNMLKLACALLCLQGRPAAQPVNAVPTAPAYFIATNEDPQIPIGEGGVLLPGAGGMVSALSTVSGRSPDAVCGKPYVDMAKILFEEEGITDPQECLMVGDRLTTDMAFGNAAGCRTMLVLTGAESLDDVRKAEQAGHTSLLPDFIAPSLSVFLPPA
ncbi:4-nitrophenyl phosphatase [Trypanosoma rangeli]|uniref:4-nitrophenyl phosphatase n=1 Tax=Trypanosoma rangeli TaxID=5698 RepID=A0A422N412_TRYRA|nr:4-nitrophenyl phosphatase [Trypanosoma rangeli]RNF00196.1 4-nitrophenyl phosphatase [Trypanosoma rangeli]|eukprot:RNF00196.1 4-nitrophenyl phosphatase [Trypanosoma rangeli]